MDLDRLLDDARREIQKKSRAQVEEETAFKWAARSVAAYFLYEETGIRDWLADSGDYYHEAVEHAALADDGGAVLRRVRDWVSQCTETL